ncbi:hypothetical protein ACWC1D_00035 [Streptomyces sp. NPDC001478]
MPEIEEKLSREEAFNERLGGSGGRLYGATLTAAEDLPGLDGKAWGGTIVLSPGRQQYSDAKTATPMIASAYGLPISSIAVAQHPSGSANLASLKAYERYPLEDIRTGQASIPPSTRSAASHTSACTSITLQRCTGITGPTGAQSMT